MQTTTLLNGFRGDRNAIEGRERILRQFLSDSPQVFRQLVKLVKGEGCAKIAADKLVESKLLDPTSGFDGRNQAIAAGVNEIDTAIILSAVTINGTGGALTFDRPYKTRAGVRKNVKAATPVAIAAQAREAHAATA